MVIDSFVSLFESLAHGVFYIICHISKEIIKFLVYGSWRILSICEMSLNLLKIIRGLPKFSTYTSRYFRKYLTYTTNIDIYITPYICPPVCARLKMKYMAICSESVFTTSAYFCDNNM